MNLEVNDLVVSNSKPDIRYRVLWVSDDGKQVDAMIEDEKIDGHWVEIFKAYSNFGFQCNEVGLFTDYDVESFKKIA